MKLNLRSTLIIISIILSFSSIGIAQNGYEVSVGRRTLNLRDSTVFVLEIHRAVEKDVISSWKKAVEEKKVKFEIKNDQLTIIGILIEEIDDSPIDIHSTVVQQDKGVKLYSVFIVDGVRVDPKGREGASVKVRKLLARFGSEVYLNVLERELKEKESRLKELTKEREKNLKSQDKTEKGIQKDSLSIGTNETDIALLKGQLQSATERYNEKKNFIATTKFATKDEAKEAKGQLKDLDKERKGIEKDIKKHSSTILDLKSEARDYGYELNQLQEELIVIEEKLVNQRAEVNRAKEEVKTYPK